jgi:exodeoxyribonuclease V gamma subunit
LVEATLDSRAAARGFLSRGVTFCQLVPMRSVPFKVACLLGMGDEGFPSRRVVPAFDRLQREHRVGDRVPRDDDRHVFLEALLCTREHFILTYVGRSAHDDRERPAAIVVTDLLAAVARGFELPDAPEGANAVEHQLAIEQRLTVRHRLHAFSARYFTPVEAGGDPRLFSYAASYCSGARSLGREAAEPRFIDKPLELPALTELTVDQLVAWVTQPLKALVQRELRVYLGSDFEPIPDREPTELDGLGKWSTGTQLSELLLNDVPQEDLRAIVRASGTLPVGSNGVVALEDVMSFTEKLVSAVRRYREGPRLPPEPVDLVVAGVHLTGTLRTLWPAASIELSYSKAGKRFELAHFVRHLVLCALREQTSDHARAVLPSKSVVVGRAKSGDEAYVVEFAPVERPMVALAELVACVHEARSRGLPFEHDPAFEFALAAHAKQGGEIDPTRFAKDVFPERFPNLYVSLVYRDAQSLLDAGFAEVAKRTFERMLNARVLPEER